jgi:hypothetical protein
MTSDKSWGVERWLAVLTFCASVVMVIFGVGMQWQKTSAIETSVTELRGDYVRRDVYNSDQRALREAIDRLSAAISQMASHERTHAPEPVTR